MTTKIKYVVGQFSEDVRKVRIARETAKTIFYEDGLKAAKDSQFDHFFDTWAEAHNWLFGYHVKQVEFAELRANEARKKLEKVRGLVETP